jgi:SWI/SNF-related matrix-associated actin-dependent regulator 1 of chromatin subfamily A
MDEIEAAAAMALVASNASDASIDIPSPPGLEYLPYQKAGIAYALTHPRCLIADVMGLGKTIQAIGLANALPDCRRVLILCPASLRINWQREWQKWDTKGLTVGIAEGKVWPDAEVVILSYSILGKHLAATRAAEWDLVIMDESQYLKNSKAQRTKEALGGGSKGNHISPIPTKRLVMLSGTPIMNRPIEFWTTARALDPQGLGRDYWSFVKTYCGAFKGRFGWDLTGSSNLTELNRIARSRFMVRRQQEDVLSELPPLRRQLVVLAPNGAAQEVKREMAAWERHEKASAGIRDRMEAAEKEGDQETYRRAVDELRTARRVAFTEMAKERYAVGMAKVPAVIEHIENMLEEGIRKIVVFAHHHDVIEEIYMRFGVVNSVKLTGEMTTEARQAAVDRFQTDPECRVFVGSIKAAGVGITLTAGSHEVFAEMDWTPGAIAQAEKRCHRIGQVYPVLAQHLVFDGSLDARMMLLLGEKEDVIAEAMDDPGEIEIPIMTRPQVEPDILQVAIEPNLQVAKETKATQKKEQKVKTPSFTEEQVQAIHKGLIMLRGRCDGAIKEDGAGFNRYDADIGHLLAGKFSLTEKEAAIGQKMIRKYQRQLPKELVMIAIRS